MSEASSQAREQGLLRTAIQNTTSALRFLASDRFGLLLLIWGLLAFGLRPILIDAHHGVTGALFDGVRSKFDPFALARLASVMQFVSFTGLIVLGVIGHLRWAEHARRTNVQITDRIRMLIAGGYAVAMAVGYILFLWSPNSVFTLITHDSFIFFDATYRIGQGQTPSVDFPTALGAATLYLPALGAALSGGYAGSVELASVGVALLLCGVCAQLGASRMPAAFAATLVGVIFLVAVPAVLVEQWGADSQTFLDGGRLEVLTDNLTWAMFYNRWGWAALIPLFMALAPRRVAGAPPLAEIGGLAAVLVFLFWLKLSYFVVGVGAAGIYAALNAKPVRTLAWGAGFTLAGIAVVALATGNLFAYLRDVTTAAQISGGRNESLLGLVRKNLRDILFAAAPLAVLGIIGRLGWRDMLAAGFMMAACVFVINQNGQYQNMCALIAVATYGAVRVLGEEKADRTARMAASGGFALLAVAMFLDRGLVMSDQAYATLREQARSPAAWAGEPALRGVYIPERESLLSRVQTDATLDERVETMMLSNQMSRRQTFRQGEYMETLAAGLADLRGVVKPGESINTLDMTNPFPFLMNARAPKGGYLTLDKDRTISAAIHPAPEAMFAESDHVMIAKMSPLPWTAELVMELYAPWLTENYSERVETAYWVRWSHRKQHAQAPTQVARTDSPEAR